MARNDISNILGLTNAKKGEGDGTHSNSPALLAAASDVSTMRTFLEGEGYASSTLDYMTKNDMLSAIRLMEDPENIK